MKRRLDPDVLERVYDTYNHRRYIDPDPLQWVYRYRSRADREVVGLIAAGLAYGRVNMINRNVDQVLSLLGPHPARAVRDTPGRAWSPQLAGFQHRWTTGAEVEGLLRGMRTVLETEGSLEACFLRGYREAEDLCAGLSGLVQALNQYHSAGSLLSDPRRGSACKRMMMYLRWMVRKDAVDPGCWKQVSPAHLLYPLDTHVYGICRRFRITRRKQANLATAREVTRWFARKQPEDPVKYDFALARLGIRSDASVDELG